jgi:Sulfotransferase domain
MKVFLASYPRSGNTLVRKYFSILQGRSQESIYDKDTVSESKAKLTDALDHVELVKSHQLSVAHGDIIYLVRDGRNSVLSFLYLKFLCGDLDFRNRKDICAAIQCVDAQEGTWAAHIQEAVHLGKQQRILFVRYEDVIRDPVLELTRMASFLGVSVTSSVLNQCVEQERASTSFADNPLNGFSHNPDSDSIYAVLKHYRKESYWRYLFDVAACEYFHRQGSTEFLLRFGYEKSSDWWKMG